MIATVYLKETGQIMWTIDSDPVQIQAQVNSMYNVVEGKFNAQDKYINNKAVIDRPEVTMPPTTVDVGESWFANLPSGTEVFIDGEQYWDDSDDGLSLVFMAPGEYTVELKPPFPWKEVPKFQITVT